MASIEEQLQGQLQQQEQQQFPVAQSFPPQIAPVTTPPDTQASVSSSSRPVARIVEKDMLFLANLFLCSTKPIDVSNVDFDQMAQRMNLKDARSARVRYNQIKNKLIQNLNPGAQTTPLKRGRPMKVTSDSGVTKASPAQKKKSKATPESPTPAQATTPAQPEMPPFSTDFS